MRIALITIASLALYGCGEHKAQPEKPAAAPVAVSTVTAAEENWPSVYEAVGSVKARTTAVLSSKVMGYVREVRVHAGDLVREGQVLVVLDARDLDAGYRQAEAARNEASSAVPEVDNAIASAKANLDLAKVTYGRMKDLFDKRSISNQELDETAARLKVAQAGYEMALARRKQLESKIAQAEQGFQSAQVTRSYAQIIAPFAGLVTEKPVEPGNLAAPGSPLLTLEREGAYRLEAAVEESRLSLVKMGQTVAVQLDALPGDVQGHISEIAPAVDASARSFTVKVDLPAMPQLRSGLFGRARFAFGSRNALAVPETALVRRGDLISVLVADGGSAKMRLVTLGQRAGNRAEVLSGLNAGEKVIVPVPAGLADGAPVEVRP